MCLAENRALLLTLLLAVFCCWPAGTRSVAAQEAEEPLPDKSGYNLFNPTPPDMMRELEPGRPDQTDSPFTVDAGHYQVESVFAAFTDSRSNGVHTDSWNIAPTTIRIGLLNNADLQFSFDNYLIVHSGGGGAPASTQSGFGDLTTGLRINLWGNEGGKTAFGILPFLKIPTNTGHLGNNAVEGGVIFPLDVKLPGGWDLGMQTEADFFRNSDNHNYHTAFVDAATFAHDLFGNLGGYVEFFSSVSTESGSDWVGTVDVGLTYGLTKNIQLDCGVNLGVTRSAEDMNSFAGFTIRF